MEYRELRESIIYYANQSIIEGLNKGTDGNFSERSADGEVFGITPSGVPYPDLKPEDIILVNMEGKIIDGVRKPSSELPIHYTVMKHRKDVNGIVHTHSFFSTVMSVMNMELPAVNTFAALYHPVKVAPFRIPATQDVADSVINTLGDTGKAVFMQNHGIVVVGDSLGSAYKGANFIEEAAKLTVYARAAGQIVPIPDEMIPVMKAHRRK